MLVWFHALTIYIIRVTEIIDNTFENTLISTHNMIIILMWKDGIIYLFVEYKEYDGCWEHGEHRGHALALVNEKSIIDLINIMIIHDLFF